MSIDQLGAMLLFTVRATRAADLPELIEAVRAALPDTEASAIHDNLNSLIQDGSIVLSNTGVYLAAEVHKVVV
jgi:hypothetical protein